MNRTIFDEIPIKDNFAVAQVALYLFAILQMVLALMTVMGVVPLGIAPEASMLQRVSATANSVVSILCFPAGYLLLARCLDRCTALVWRIALGVFLSNVGLTVLAIMAQPGPYPVLTCGLSIAGAISVLKGRSAIRE